MPTFSKLLQIYRASLKRLPFVHRTAYFLAQNVALPLLEKRERFWTLPDDPVNFRLELLLQKYEPETSDFFKSHIKPGMILLDIGAHVGYYTRLFSELVGPSGLVIAFEPHPVHFQYLKQNVYGLDNVKLVNKAVGNEPGIAPLYDMQVDSGSSSLRRFEEKWQYVRSVNVGEISPRLQRVSGTTKTFEVEVVTLDEELEPTCVSKVDAIKMDIEGAEVSALQGAKRLLKKSNSFIVFELAPTNLKGFGYTARDLLKILSDYGYHKVEMIGENGVELLTKERLESLIMELEMNSRINCVACKDQDL